MYQVHWQKSELNSRLQFPSALYLRYLKHEAKFPVSISARKEFLLDDGSMN